MIKTDFYYDSLEYYTKARFIQERNLGCPIYKDTLVDDQLMENVHIYDTVNRRYAGFNKAIEDVMGTRHPVFARRFKSFRELLDLRSLHFLMYFHRFTGSGASFEPRLLPNGELNPREHGYCNSQLENVGNIMVENGVGSAQTYIANLQVPFVTSKGNQPPSLKNNRPERYRLATQYYFDNFAHMFIRDYAEYITKGKQKGIKETVDWCLDWHSKQGFKRWKFVITAFVMDTAEYYPNLVDPKSHVYYGSNCIRTMDLCFEKEKSDKMSKQEWYERCMEEWMIDTGGNPYELEDVPGCDYIRYIKEYIPAGYEHLEPHQKVNNSVLKIDGRYDYIHQKRIELILGK